jgi:hypothetical protein
MMSTFANHPANPYLRRAALYAALDALLCNRTRFFGAAAQTNSVLGALLAPACIPLSGGTRHFLGEIGGQLEILNLSIARNIAMGLYPHQDLDQTMVQTEQSAVQSQIDEWCLHDPRRFDLVSRDLDELMNARSLCSLFGRMHAAASSYLGTLSEVRRGLGRPIAFIRQEDRVSVGRALINRIRRHSGAARR